MHWRIPKAFRGGGMSVESAFPAPAGVEAWSGRRAGWEKPAAQTSTPGFGGNPDPGTAIAGRVVHTFTNSQIRGPVTPACLRKVC
jgi:hypothetical protein